MGNQNPEEFDFNLLPRVLEKEIEFTNDIYNTSRKHIREEIRRVFRQDNSPHLATKDRVSELEQVVWGQIGRSFEKFDPELATFKTWVNKIIRRVVENSLKKAHRDHKRALNSLEFNDELLQDDSNLVLRQGIEFQDPSKVFEKKEFRERIWRIIHQRANDLEFLLATLRYKYDLTPAEIEEQYGIPSVTVTKKLDLLKRRLTKLLKDNGIDNF